VNVNKTKVLIREKWSGGTEYWKMAMWCLSVVYFFTFLVLAYPSYPGKKTIEYSLLYEYCNFF